MTIVGDVPGALDVRFDLDDRSHDQTDARHPLVGDPTGMTNGTTNLGDRTVPHRTTDDAGPAVSERARCCAPIAPGSSGKSALSRSIRWNRARAHRDRS